MKLVDKMIEKKNNLSTCEGVTIAFLGDSVTQGCFEIFHDEKGEIETVYDKRYSYEMYLLEILNMLYPRVTVNIINAGISGDKAPRGLERLDRDVLRHEPDLVVVCYGLNDCRKRENSMSDYTEALEGIFKKVKAAGCELIFMTPNMMNTMVSPHIADKEFAILAKGTAEMQNDGTFDAHIEGAREVCRKMGVPVCDCYAIWKKLHESGVETTELLSNKINHPTREMNKLFAYELARVIFS